MKLTHLYKRMLVLALAAGTSLSCEDAQTDIFVPANIYFPKSGNVEIVPLAGESVYDFAVYKSGINQSGSVKAVVEVDKSLGNSFIASNPGYSILPDQNYSLASGEISIGEGEERGMVKINFKGIGSAALNGNFVLPLQIKSVNGNASVLESKKTAYLLIKRFRNAFEGDYRIEGVKEATGVSPVKIQSVSRATTVDASTIRIPGAESDMIIDLKIEGNTVSITPAPGSEKYEIRNTPGKNSTWAGEFDASYQRNKGTFKLFYTYVLNGREFNVTKEVKFWL